MFSRAIPSIFGRRSAHKCPHKPHRIPYLVEVNPIPTRISSRCRKYKSFPRSRSNSSLVTIQRATIENRQVSRPPSILLSNARSVRYKMDELMLLVRQHLPSFVIITESWLDFSISDSLLCIPGYQMFRRDRGDAATGGGVLVYARSNIDCKRRVDLECDDVESIWIQFKLSSPFLGISKSFLCALYHPPSANVFSLSEHLTDALQSLNSIGGMPFLLLAGDFNHAKPFCLTGFTPLVNAPTRGLAILDQVYTNFPNFYRPPSICAPLGTSDHNCVLVWPVSHSKEVPRSQRVISSRKKTNSSLSALRLALQQVDWSPLLSLANVQEIADHLYGVFEYLLDAHMPRKEFVVRSTDKQWVTPSIKQLICNKHKAFRANSGRYKGKSSIVWNKILKSAIKKSKSTLLEKALGSDKLFWRTVRQTIGLDSDCDLPPSVVSDALESFSTSNVAEAFSLLYQSKWQTDPVPLPQLTHYRSPSLSIMDVECLLRKSKNKNTTGPDNIPAWFLREFSSELAYPSSVLFNAVLSSSQSPKQWHTQRVTPVPKTSNPRYIKDFRPIAISSSFGKVLERFVRDNLVLELGENFDKAQFGFRSESSCTTALIFMMHNWLSSLDQGNDVRTVCLDFSAAFDRLPHTVIVSKLTSLGVSEWLVAYVTDFLSHRTQFVCLPDSTISSTLKVNSGVPQGSIIAPLLFAVAVHDLPTVAGCHLAKYADDSTIWRSIHSPSSHLDLQRCVNEIAVWCDKNDILINPSKSVELPFSFKRSRPPAPPLLCNGSVIPQVSSSKLLGVQLTSNFSFSDHISAISKRATKTLFFLRRLKLAGASSSELLRVYCSFTRPILEYCSPLWDGLITARDSECLERLQRRAIHICGADINALPTLKARRGEARRNLFQSARQSRTHSLHELIPGRLGHKCNTRASSAGCLQVPRSRTTRFQSSFIVQCTRDFNSTL